MDNSLYVKAEKCEFHVPSVSFLGYIIAKDCLHMDPAKVSAVTSWPVPETRKQLGAIASPFSALTSSKTSFQWTDKAQGAFDILKTRFTSAPILQIPDAQCQFIVEVDASSVGVGAVLSQRSTVDQKVHPCAFFSRCLSSTERNYDIGNRELLAGKLALEEWRQWLEGAKVPFIVWTDHRNLEYIRSAKRLNSRQARWSLFFDRFNFTLSYRPGSRNIKPDALSRQFPECPDVTAEPSTIVPASCLIASVTWEIEERVRAATEDQPGPSSCPTDRLFVPAQLRSDVLQWGHASQLSCHPGIMRTRDFLQQRFWWSSLEEDVRSFVNACPVCNQNKSSRHPPAGFLHPLPVPQHPWSHISLDFVTGLPTSKGQTAILTVIDRFSKMAHFIPLSASPVLPHQIYTHSFHPVFA